MTREEIINIPELVDFMLDESVIADSREKLRKRLEEVCNLAIKALEQESCGDAISREDTMTALRANPSFICPGDQLNAIQIVEGMPPVTPQYTDTEIQKMQELEQAEIEKAYELGKAEQPKIGWNNHQIACMLADLFGDACACNYNGIDEWLGELCDFKDTCCPNPVGVACWEQFLKYSQSRYTECGYEARDKNALQDPKTGHWVLVQRDKCIDINCSECGNTRFKDYACGHTIDELNLEKINDLITKIQMNYCECCGAKMHGVQK